MCSEGKAQSHCSSSPTPRQIWKGFPSDRKLVCFEESSSLPSPRSDWCATWDEAWEGTADANSPSSSLVCKALTPHFPLQTNPNRDQTTLCDSKAGEKRLLLQLKGSGHKSVLEYIILWYQTAQYTPCYRKAFIKYHEIRFLAIIIL